MRPRTRSRTVALACTLAVCAAGPLVVSACGSRTGLDVAEGAAVLDAGQGPDAPRSVRVPLDCAEAGITYIYAIGEDNSLYSFYPTTGEFTFIGVLDCPAAFGATPFSMAVDHRGTAYVVFNDGTLFQVSTKTSACEATSFVPGQHGFANFGMGFAANVGDGGTGETLYVAGDMTGALATIDLDTYTLNVVAPFQDAGNAIDMAELTGTGDGRLFAFFAPLGANETPPSFIDQINPKNAEVLSSVLLPDVVEGEGWAFGFWGGDFYTFTAPDGETTVVTRYRPSDGSITQVASAPVGVVIVGAGVSTCAPQQ
jgi:hypothetical protein